MDHLLLASASPRRRELLARMDIPFDCLDPDIDESDFDHLSIPQRCSSLAIAKAHAGLCAKPHSAWVLGADTLVWLPETEDVLGKPSSRADARRMISLLSGKCHAVCTALALIRGRDGIEFTTLSESRVSFAPLAEDELDEYLRVGDWEGVAGAYRIQGYAARFIDSIKGSWSGIVGLPIRELYVMLRKADFRPLPVARA